jgi:hypothetical protein
MRYSSGKVRLTDKWRVTSDAALPEEKFAGNV